MINLRLVNKNQFIYAKRMWLVSIGIKVIMYLLGVIAIFLFASSGFWPVLLLVLAILSEIFQVISDDKKNNAEALLRKLDINQSFGYQISEADMLDIIYAAPRKTKKKLREGIEKDSYFASERALGPQKAIENLQESVWYTMNQAKSMSIMYFVLILALLMFSVVALLIVFNQIDDIGIRYQISRIISASLLLIVSLNMIRTALAYFKAYQECRQVNVVTNSLLQSTQVTEVDALKQWYEYQLKRASTPLMPEWLWKIKKDDLEKAWAQIKSKNV